MKLNGSLEQASMAVEEAKKRVAVCLVDGATWSNDAAYEQNEAGKSSRSNTQASANNCTVLSTKMKMGGFDEGFAGLYGKAIIQDKFNASPPTYDE